MSSHRENSMQNACTSMNRSCTLMILLRMRDCRNTHTSRTSRFCMYLSLMLSHDAMQLEMYMCTNSIGSSTACAHRPSPRHPPSVASRPPVHGGFGVRRTVGIFQFQVSGDERHTR